MSVEKYGQDGSLVDARWLGRCSRLGGLVVFSVSADSGLLAPFVTVRLQGSMGLRADVRAWQSSLIHAASVTGTSMLRVYRQNPTTAWGCGPPDLGT